MTTHIRRTQELKPIEPTISHFQKKPNWFLKAFCCCFISTASPAVNSSPLNTEVSKDNVSNPSRIYGTFRSPSPARVSATNYVVESTKKESANHSETIQNPDKPFSSTPSREKSSIDPWGEWTSPPRGSRSAASSRKSSIDPWGEWTSPPRGSGSAASSRRSSIEPCAE